MPDARYGTTLDDVAAFLPHRTLDANSRPNTTQVDTFLSHASGYVHARVGTSLDVGVIPETDERQAALDLAKSVVVLRAAAMTEDAGLPEDTGGDGYGVLLWERARETLGDLLLALGLDPNTPGGSATIARDTPSYSFPTYPLFTRDEIY
jgi:hypothetical protein